MAFKAAEYCQELGIDLIITDHHQPDKQLPPAFAIIHSTRTSGSGVAYWFANQIKNQILNSKNTDQKLNRTKNYQLTTNNYLDLATIGTIADVIPLQGINRNLVYHGLKSFVQNQRPGLHALFKISKVDQQAIEPYHISHIIAPRINAMSRLEHGIEALRLLCTRNSVRAQKLAQLLNHTNVLRQDETEQTFKHAQHLVQQINSDQKIIIVGDQTFSEGVIGLVASKLVETFYKPAIVYTQTDQGIKASVRSINEYNIIQALREIDIEFLSVGGHPMAAGFTIQRENLEEFSRKISIHAQKYLKDLNIQPSLEIDTQIELSDITDQLYHQIQKFAPFGYGNPAPMFATQNVNIINVWTVGKQNQHLKIHLKQKGLIFNAIAFNQSTKLESISKKQPVDLAYQIIENKWNGKRNLELIIKDIHFHI